MLQSQFDCFPSLWDSIANQRQRNQGSSDMKTTSLHQLLLMVTIASFGLTSATAPGLAQQAPPRWKPGLESVIISALKPNRNYRLVLSSSRLGEAFLVSASMEVPYSDLNLAREPDASELGRRIHVAARLVCLQLDR